MAQTFEEALALATSTCTSLSDRLKRTKVMLEAMERAMFNSASGGGVIKYKVNTGQTVTEVESGGLSQLKVQYRDLLALYNELCGLVSGANVMVIRDASTAWR